MEKANREKILHKRLEYPGWSALRIAKDLKLPKSTVYDVLNRFKGTLTVERKPGSGGKKGARDPELEKRVLRSLDNSPGLFDNQRAEKLKTTRNIVRQVKKRHGYKSFKAIKSPNRTAKQNIAAKSRARKLYDRVLTKTKGCIIMDDETYVKLDLRQLPGQKWYVSNVRLNVPEKFKYVKLDKYAKKLMIWQAICSCGLKSEAFVTSSTMTAELYVQECLEKRLLPMIKQHRAKTKFWPDLASVHYAGTTMQWYKRMKVDVVDKGMNPPNCPELRPIEKFWANVKRLLKRNGGYVKDVKAMRLKWNKFAAKITRKDVQVLMAPIKRNTREFFRTNEN